MNKTLVSIIEILLIVIYLGSVLFVLDSSSVSGLIQIGGASAVLFILIMVLEKRKDKEVGDDGMPIQQTQITPDTQLNQEQTQQIIPQQPSQNQQYQQPTQFQENQQSAPTEFQQPPQQ